jgi:hypothetical protein
MGKLRPAISASAWDHIDHAMTAHHFGAEACCEIRQIRKVRMQVPLTLLSPASRITPRVVSK